MKNINYKNKPLLIITLASLLIIGMTGCNKLVEIDAPVTSINEENIFKSDATAIAALTGIYSSMSNSGFFSGGNSISLLAGLSADELTLFSGISSSNNLSYYYRNELVSPTIGSELWSPLYSNIYRCNAAIEGLNSSNDIASSVKQQLIGEAKFIRAFCYFYLVNLFGDAPLALQPDFQVNTLLERSPSKLVYEQIITDLNDAKDLLSSVYLDGNLKPYIGVAERIRPTKWAATALLSRVYLCVLKYSEAEAQANDLINNTTLFGLTDLNTAFLKNSKEAIWQIQPVNTGWNTEDAKIFVINAAPGTTKPVTLSSSLLNSFEINDGRKKNWKKDTIISSVVLSYPFKYKSAKLNNPVTEYLMVLRLGEQYLIRAEARANQGSLSSIDDLNFIRNRAGLPNYSGLLDKGSILNAIMHERQVEMFTEWGCRWIDLKRNGSVDAVMSLITPLKANGKPWNAYQKYYPLPQDDVDRAPNIFQNDGY